jgi:sugar/nucleoside kinase (ribokinase family)
VLLIAGTVPIEDIPLTVGKAIIEGETLEVAGTRLPCAQGTAAMVSTAAITLDYLGLKEPPTAALIGDIGNGAGSKKLYRYLIDSVDDLTPKVVALHYIMPVIPLMEKVVAACKKCSPVPRLIADAGSMYAAKAAGLSRSFQIMTPDAGEMSFLADPKATHPAYIQHYFFNAEPRNVPDLIRQAFERNDAPETLIVKGSTDFIATSGEVVETVSEPDVPAMEAIGGTGDTITGMVSAFLFAGLEAHQACILAAKANRIAGLYAGITPASPVTELIGKLPEAFRKHLCEWSGVCMR